MHNASGRYAGYKSPPVQMDVSSQGTGSMPEQGARVMGRDVYIALASSPVQTARTASWVSSTQRAEAAKMLAEQMFIAIGTDDFFATQNESVLECLFFSSEETEKFKCQYPLEPYRIVRAALKDFVAREMQEGFSAEVIMKHFVDACAQAEVSSVHVDDMKIAFRDITVRQAPEIPEASDLMEVQETNAKPVQSAADRVCIRRLEAALRQARVSDEWLQGQLQTAADNVRQLQQTSEKNDADYRALQKDYSALLQRNQLLEQQMVSFQIAADPGQTDVSLRQALTEAQAELNRSKAQKAMDDRTIASLSLTQAQLQEECRSLREQLRQVQAGRSAPPVASAEIQPQARAEDDNLDNYGSNAEVNDFIRTMTMRGMARAQMVRRIMLRPTLEHHELWKQFWKDLTLVTESDIETLRQNFPDNLEEQVVKLFDRAAQQAARHPEDMKFITVFQSVHLPECLRRALYNAMEESIAVLKKKYSRFSKA